MEKSKGGLPEKAVVATTPVASTSKVEILKGKTTQENLPKVVQSTGGGKVTKKWTHGQQVNNYFFQSLNVILILFLFLSTQQRGNWRGANRGGFQRGGWRGGQRGGWQGSQRGGWQGGQQSGWRRGPRGGYSGQPHGGWRGCPRGAPHGGYQVAPSLLAAIALHVIRNLINLDNSHM